MADSPVDIGEVSSAVVSANAVEDVTVLAASDSTVTVGWTQVDDGTGNPARYRLKYAAPPLAWSSAELGCDVTGEAVGASASCTIEGLDAGATYDFQLMSYRLQGRAWKGAVYSSITTGVTTSPADAEPADAEPTDAHVVADLTATQATQTTLTVSWTEVDDGTGSPARYRVKYARPAIDWSSATVGCNLTGEVIDRTVSCTIEGLDAGVVYDVQLMSYRLAEGSSSWQGGVYSNVTTSETLPPDQTSDPISPSGAGIWLGLDEIAARPTSGAAWDQLLADAARDPGPANISDMHSSHDVYTLAAALVCARTGQYCSKARQGVLDAIGTEDGGQWLEVGRNLGAYVIAADILGLRADGTSNSEGTRVEEWIEGWLTKRLPDNITWELRAFGPFHSAANAAAQEGFAFAAVAAYLRDETALARAWDTFRTHACDPEATDPDGQDLDKVVSDGWAHDDSRPCAVNPAGTSKVVPTGLPGAGRTLRLDGSLGGDMRRGGAYQWEPGYTQYPWVGLEGFIPAAAILDRAGYPAFEIADRAVLRTHEYMWFLRNETGDDRWFDGERAREIVHLVNAVYGTSFPVNRATGGGRTVGYTDWTHIRP
jgi:hypothetical protein